MSIGRGGDWGELVARPERLRVAADDAEVVRMLGDPSADPVALGGGDLHRTVGARALDGRDELLRLPVDLVEVVVDDRRERVLCVAHVVARRRWRRGGGWRGPVLAVMNAEYLGDLDVAPRGHPGDGRVETFALDPSTSVRQRIEMRRRARGATHLPHPSITTRSVRSGEWTFDEPLVVAVDGRPIGSVRRLAITVLPDAAVVLA
ncbi:hypothetical protein [Ilumatobacter sp.]|uniref:hypothetical protein n=1 Tax=Ilumatobacter sp. TaxID=1967498 RepID=UPI003B51A139